MNYPPCFESADQFTDWKKFARASAFDSAASVCADCTPEYKDRMMKEDRCSEPRVTFVMFHGELIGELPIDRIKQITSKTHPWGSGAKLLLTQKGG